MSTENIKELNMDSFDSEISAGITLVDFWAEWCAPCKMIAPIIEQLAEQYAGRVSFCKVNVDSEQGLAVRYGVMSIPTLVLFKDGEPTDRIVGVTPKRNIEQLIDKVAQ